MNQRLIDEAIRHGITDPELLDAVGSFEPTRLPPSGGVSILICSQCGEEIARMKIQCDPGGLWPDVFKDRRGEKCKECSRRDDA